MNKSSLKCLYIYDNRFINYRGNIYSKSRMTDSVFSRYITPEDKLTVISRMEFYNSPESLHKATEMTLENVNFKPIKGLFFSRAFSIHLIKNLTLFSSEIKDSDFIVTRLPSFLGVFGLTLNLLFKKKFFIEVAGDAQDALLTSKDNPNLLYKGFTQVFFKLNQFFIKQADGVIYVTKTALQRKYPTKSYSSYASNIEIDIPEKNLSYDNYQFKGNIVKIGLIGDYNNHYKGIREAIRSICQLQKYGFNVDLHIVGSGTLLTEYMQLAKDLKVDKNIFFKGRLKGNKEVLGWLESLDLYIQPSYTEGLPRALIEAMSVGLPSVASDVGGVAELIPSDFLVHAKDSNALTNKIIELLNSQQLRFELGSLNYKVSKSYDQSILIARRKSFWKKCRAMIV
ncbi:glycosyltransferase [Psychrobacter faecalis]|uniref:glycosyltransferase n=1 Tax=Psychrobacter faecalis TaxID=180588 RepID=UPI0018E05FB1|nr:glycosyltransferase [Psychrobacter faecalis]